jgi:DNA-binding NarL/FixJ family response regulator
MATRILIYDDNAALRMSMDALLSDEHDMDVVAAIPNPENVKKDLEMFKPDVVLMDIDMPAVSGVQAVKMIRNIYKDLPVIMLTVFDDNENIFKAICAGASGYILKMYATEEVPAGIRNVLKGGAPMTGSIAKKVLTMVPQAKTPEQEKCNLTAKETAILQLLVNGFSYKMIAAEVKISIDTVRFHIKKIYDKLHVHSATEAVSRTLRDNLLAIFL